EHAWVPTRYLLRFGHQVFVDDAFGHVPERVEFDLLDLARGLGGRTLGFADDRRVALHPLPRLDGLDLRRRYVDQDITIGRCGRERLETLQIGLALGKPDRGRNIEGRDHRARVDDARRRKALT